MFSLGETDKYYLYSSPCDMRKGFDTLSGIVASVMQHDPTSGGVFIFLSRSRRTLKLLHWESGGYVIYHKRLEKGQFSRPHYDEKTGCYRLKWVELVMMTDGISLDKVVCKKRYKKPCETA